MRFRARATEVLFAPAGPQHTLKSIRSPKISQDGRFFVNLKDSDNDTLGDHRIDPFIAIPHFMQSNRNEIVRGVGVTAFWTLVSRILGMVRDVVTAALFGLAAGGVMDAFVIAFRLPNLFRRLFGEGILSVSVLPAITEKIENDKPSAWQLVSTLIGCVFLLMTLITLVGEVACMLLWYFSTDDDIRLVAGLSAVMLPYLVFISLASIVSATLHALNRFGMPAFVPVILNSLWIGVVLWITSREQKDLHAAAYAIAATVFLGGLFQFIAQWAVLRSLEFRWGWNWVACRKSIKEIGKRFVPMAFGLAIFPLNVLVDTMIAWIFSAPADTEMSWWGGGLVYPLSEGTVAAIYFSERLIQFPVGLLGVAIGVVVFPTFSRQASQGDLKQLGTSLRNSMRGNLILAIPATAGLVLLAEPITTLLFEHGEFTQVDVMRTSQMITTYALGIWAYSLVPILVRGFYATGDSRTPFRLGLAVLFLNLLLDFFLIWRWGENALALSSALSVILFVGLLGLSAHRRWRLLTATSPDEKSLWVTILQSLFATGVMYEVGWFASARLSVVESTFSLNLMRVGIPFVFCLVVYLLISALLGIRR